jgi:hypothetical protein
VRTFAARLAETIKGTTLSDQAAQQLAQICWTVVAGRDLSQRQSELVRQEFRTQLVALGVADAAVQRTVADVAAAQTAVNTRPRRWYERF